MRRKFRDFISLKTLKYLCYIPSIIYQIKNWPSFILNYIGVRDRGALYFFRNGIKIKTKEGIDTVTIAVIFVRKDYGNVEKNSVVIDIGANIGIYSIFATSASKSTTIYAYEPEPNNFNLLLENIRLNKLEENIAPFKLAICGRQGKRKLYLGDTSPFHSLYSESNFRGGVEVECVSLKDIFDENKIKECDILKLDCEGAEFEIFYNAPDEYLRKIKKIRLEYHKKFQNRKYSIECLINFFERRGFKIRSKKDFKHSGILWLDRCALYQY